LHPASINGARLIQFVSDGFECGNQVAFFFRAGFDRLVRLQANAIRAQPQKILRLAITAKRLRKVLGIAYVEDFVTVTAFVASIATGDQIDSADLSEPRVERKDFEPISNPASAFEGSLA
jgi:hypothetical protein